MTIFKNISLKAFNTFGLDYKSEHMIILKSENDAIDLFKGKKYHEMPLLIMGGGSNLLFTCDFKGVILHTKMGGIKVEEQNKEYVIISAGAGVIWDSLVEWTVKRGFSGLENLSLIPGTVGASPVQNIGAYGVEIKELIERVRTISTADGSLRLFNNPECKFGYRNSIFKNDLKGKYLVTRVYYRLNVNPALNLSYGSLMDEASKLGNLTPGNVRMAVINIRRNKLPDPDIMGNAGSFFKNPVVIASEAESLRQKYPQIPFYLDQTGLIKLAAGWLIDQCGWKGRRWGEAGVHDKQALVLVNYGNATGKEIYALSEAIKKSVHEKFGIDLEREVEVIGTI